METLKSVSGYVDTIPSSGSSLTLFALIGPMLWMCVGQVIAGHKNAMTMDDASDITWAHAVNSRQDLLKELSGDADFLEADISMGHLAGFQTLVPQPIMAHPPHVTSDITLERWLDTVISKGSMKNIKLDFKSLDTVQPSLMLVQQHASKIDFCLWLNADILPGPVNSTTLPVPATGFLKLCNLYFPNATVSLGWTTYWLDTLPQESWHYDWNHVRAMADALFCLDQGPPEKITFPVRAVFACRSIPQLRWLLETIPKSTLTVWSAKQDSVEVDDLMKIRRSFPKPSVFYDLPGDLNGAFSAAKMNYTTDSSKTESYEWMVINRGGESLSCYSQTYARNGTVLLGKGVTSAALLKDALQVSDGHELEAQGFVKFFSSNDDGSTTEISENNELILVLADVSLFSKEFSHSKSKAHKVDDSNDVDVVWSAMNASQLHVFRHDFSHSPSSCQYFRLNTRLEIQFEAWTIPCRKVVERASIDDMLEHRSDIFHSRTKFILPKGPVMFGFVSSGRGHVVIHDVQVKGSPAKSANDVITGSAGIVSSSLWTFVLFLTFELFVALMN